MTNPFIKLTAAFEQMAEGMRTATDKLNLFIAQAEAHKAERDFIAHGGDPDEIRRIEAAFEVA